MLIQNSGPDVKANHLFHSGCLQIVVGADFNRVLKGYYLQTSFFPFTVCRIALVRLPATGHCAAWYVPRHETTIPKP